MEDTQKIKSVAHGFGKAVRIVRVISLVFGIICAVCFLILMILGITNVLPRIYETNPTEMGKITINLTDTYGIDFISAKPTMKELYEAGQLNNLMYVGGIACLKGAIEFFMFFVVLIFISKAFTRLETTETPFVLETAKDLKVAFILTTIIVAINSIIPGLIVGGLLACMYFMFLYGCKLQENEDQTL